MEGSGWYMCLMAGKLLVIKRERVEEREGERERETHTHRERERQRHHKTNQVGSDFLSMQSSHFLTTFLSC